MCNSKLANKRVRACVRVWVICNTHVNACNQHTQLNWRKYVGRRWAAVLLPWLYLINNGDSFLWFRFFCLFENLFALMHEFPISFSFVSNKFALRFLSTAMLWLTFRFCIIAPSFFRSHDRSFVRLFVSSTKVCCVCVCVSLCIPFLFPFFAHLYFSKLISFSCRHLSIYFYCVTLIRMKRVARAKRALKRQRVRKREMRKKADESNEQQQQHINRYSYTQLTYK